MSKLAAAGLSRTVAGPVPAGRREQRSRAIASAAADGLLEVGRALGAGEAGRPERRLEGRAALADEDRGDGPLGDDRRRARSGRRPCRGRRRSARSAASNARSAAIDGVGLGPLRVVDEADAVDHRDGLEAVLDAGERRGRPRGSRPGATPNSERRPRSRPGRSRRCGAPGIASSSIGMIRPPGPVAAGPAARERQPLDAVGDDPAVDDAEAARQRPLAPVADRRGAVPRPAYAGDDRVLGVEDERAVRVDELGQPALDPPVAPRATRAGRGGRR